MIYGQTTPEAVGVDLDAEVQRGSRKCVGIAARTRVAGAQCVVHTVPGPQADPFQSRCNGFPAHCSLRRRQPLGGVFGEFRRHCEASASFVTTAGCPHAMFLQENIARISGAWRAA
jgi:hypothetical protein